jgi:hypothetical protein
MGGISYAQHFKGGKNVLREPRRVRHVSELQRNSVFTSRAVLVENELLHVLLVTTPIAVIDIFHGSFRSAVSS